MAQTPSDIRAFGGPTGRLWFADVGTDEPTNISAAVDDSDWTDAGRLGEAGPKVSLGKATVDITTWQSFPYPDRTLQGVAVNTLGFTLVQWGRLAIAQAIGGAWTGTTPNFVFTPAGGSPAPTACILDLVDGTFKWRLIVRKSQNTAPTDFVAKGDTAAELPFEMKFLQPDGGVEPFIIQTNDAAAGS